MQDAVSFNALHEEVSRGDTEAYSVGSLYDNVSVGDDVLSVTARL